METSRNYDIGSIVFGGWRIVSKMGEGAFGNVFKLEKTDYGITTTSALKVIRIPQSQADVRSALSEGMDEKSVTDYFQGFVDEIVKEIAVMSTVKGHPNVVSYEDHVVMSHSGEIGWDILIRMELLVPLVDYQLDHKMQRDEVIRLAEELLDGLAFCQRKGVLHRDIKPENIFVSETGNFKLGDFGVAKTVEKTMSGLSKKGTESYMAPEIYLGKPYGVSVDVYSLGLVLYRLMNGNRLPFYPPAPEPIRFSDRENALIKRMQGASMPPPIEADEEFSRIILRACAYQPQERYHTAADMLAEVKSMDRSTAGRTDGSGAGEDRTSDRDQSTDYFHSDRTAGMFSGGTGQDHTTGMFSGGMEQDHTTGMFSGCAGQGQTTGAFSGVFGDGQTTGNSFVGDDTDDRTVGAFGHEKKAGTQSGFDLYSFWSQWLPLLKMENTSMLGFPKWLAACVPDLPDEAISVALKNIAKDKIRPEDVVGLLTPWNNEKAKSATKKKVYLGGYGAIGFVIAKDRFFYKGVVDTSVEALFGLAGIAYKLAKTKSKTEAEILYSDITSSSYSKNTVTICKRDGSKTFLYMGEIFYGENLVQALQYICNHTNRNGRRKQGETIGSDNVNASVDYKIKEGYYYFYCTNSKCRTGIKTRRTRTSEFSLKRCPTCNQPYIIGPDNVTSVTDSPFFQALDNGFQS